MEVKYTVSKESIMEDILSDKLHYEILNEFNNINTFYSIDTLSLLYEDSHIYEIYE